MHIYACSVPFIHKSLKKFINKCFSCYQLFFRYNNSINIYWANKSDRKKKPGTLNATLGHIQDLESAYMLLTVY